jgi:hypothetical protein
MMYRNKYYNCGPRCDCEEADVLGQVQAGIDLINKGFKEALCGLDLICCQCRICEGTKAIERALCRSEKGIDMVVNGLTDLEYEYDFRNNCNIKNGIKGVKEGNRFLRKGLCQLQKCCLCDGIESIQCGLQCLEQGLCYLTKGVNDLRGQQGCRSGC